MSDQNRNKQIAAIITLAFNIVLVLVLLFVVAWREPDPPIPQYGIQLNFGMDQQGTGTEQPVVPVRENSEQKTESSPKTTKPIETSKEVINETEEVEPVTQKTETVTQPEPSPVKNEPKQPTSRPDPVKEVKESTKPSEKEKAPASEGNDVNKQGDKGDPQGVIDSRALYGNKKGVSDGPSLDIAGWEWDQIPRPNDQSQENGKIVFRIIVDEYGYISARTLETTVSPSLVNLYKEALESASLRWTSQKQIPPQSEGKVTFILKAR